MLKPVLRRTMTGADGVLNAAGEEFVILKSMFSMAAINMLKAGCSLLISFLVAKTVAPDAFGLVSFAVPLMTFITILTDLGLASAIVRHPDLSREDCGTAVVLLFIAGGVGGIVLALAAGLLERAVALAGLSQVLIGFGFVTAFTIWAAAPRATLERHYAYRKITMIEFPALFAGLAGCAAMIWLKQGIMAIVVYQIAMQAVRAAGFLWLARPFYVPNTNWHRLAGLGSVGGWLLFTNILTYCARNLDRILIGAYLGARTLGIYGLAYQFMTIPLVLITWPISGVLLSTLSRLRDLPSAQKEVTCAVMMCTAAVTFPGMAVLTFGATVPLHLIYSDKWTGLAAAVAFLAPAGAAQSIAAYGGATLVERGAIKLNFVLSTLNGGAFISIFFATVWFGLNALMSAYMVVSIAICVMYIHFICKISDISYRQLLDALMPGLASAGLGLAVTWALAGLNPQDLAGWGKSVGVYAVVVVVTMAASLPTLLRSFGALSESGVAIGNSRAVAA